MSFGPITLDHIGIATESLVDGSPFWTLIGLTKAQMMNASRNKA